MRWIRCASRNAVPRSLGALTTLAQSAALKSGNMAAFYDEAAATARPPDVWTLLIDESGAQLINTLLPFASAPPPLVREGVAHVLATGTPVVTDVFRGRASGKLLTTIYVPAATVAGRRHVVAQAVSVEHWKQIVMRPPDRSDWIIAVIDRQGRFVSAVTRPSSASVSPPARSWWRRRPVPTKACCSIRRSRASTSTTHSRIRP